MTLRMSNLLGFVMLLQTLNSRCNLRTCIRTYGELELRTSDDGDDGYMAGFG